MEAIYDQLFSSDDPLHYLSRYMLMRSVAHGARGKPQWTYFKWLVLGFCWTRLAPVLSKRARLQAFTRAWERQDAALRTPLAKAIDLVFLDAFRFFKAGSGAGVDELDPSQFFRSHKGRDHEFETFWARNGNKARASLDQAIDQVAAALVQE